MAIEKYSSLQFNNQINAFIGFDLRHYEYGNFLTKELITKRGNPYARKILFKCIHNSFNEAIINRLIRIMYYLITQNKL